MLQDRRQDLHLTSTGKGHEFRGSYYFPDSTFRTTVLDPLPPPLSKQDEVHPYDSLINNYETTTGKVHDYKYMGGVLSNPLHKKAPGHWKVHYVKDLHEKLQVREALRPALTMGNQKTEVQDNFNAKRGLSLDSAFNAGPQNPTLRDHHVDGPTKAVIASTKNDALSGQPFYARDQGVLRLNDMYITTTHKDHRPFSRHEMEGYPRKDIPTYWQCEDYPKAWGHGLKHNPLPKDASRISRETPMRDITWFPTATRIPRLPKKLSPVPHSGLKTLYSQSYIEPSDVKSKDIFSCPVDTPWVIPDPGPLEAFAVPSMYNTEYMTYASGKPISV
ncbi:stabilizer of axonemal microtubules 3-like [Branchiostoma floridae x Branchiostoma japonicum]